LAHVVEAATIRAVGQGATQVEATHLFGERADPNIEDASAGTFEEETRRFQQQLLRDSLEATGWNIAATARRLDLTRSHVYNLIKNFGLSRRQDA
jgi:Nif-specific regulatory protein